ncbi:putative ATP-grasp superfamily ATP-dependent carboligase [Methylobacterium sp. BE186]|uniref:ATP-grasp domain-containing protein n=1 Tax=Methylobacterium sp. BE186 TaxID=2817715 RepID=UPI0028633165|nr:ATP-grasp domain-containing protein [Methylobacterium sp. BE186]MDR7037263.1 putative ATP-grasp superfamily ATP-dependent carboligase [Methylobacterium sp. BE186]
MAGEALLVAAQSGRALAESARRAGLRPFVADLFGDADTLDLAEAYRPLPGRFGTGRLGGGALLAALEALAERAGPRCLGVVLGSGLEGAPDLMAEIARRHRLIGAAPEAVATLKDPLGFAALCARLAIPHPAVAREAVDDPANWLLKRAGGSGGSHIRAATRGRAPQGAYFQARVPGRALGLSLLADGRDIAILGFTEQWSAPSRLRPFRYGGAVLRGATETPALPARLTAEIAGAVARLAAETGLRGLASADLLSDGERWWLTEINPRPGATLDILDRSGESLLLAHVSASEGRLPPLGAPPVDAAAAEICYGARDYRPVPRIAWPDHARDRPRAGTDVARDAPLCTLLATGRDGAAARAALRERAACLHALLDQEETDEHECEVSERQRADGAPGGAPRR